MMPSTDERCAWLALTMIPGLGGTVIRELLKRFGDPETILEASVEDLLETEGVRREIARKISGKKFVSDPEDEWRKVEAFGARIIAFADSGYPEYLKELRYPPIVLYAHGLDIPAADNLIAVIGSRNPTHYGLNAAERMGMGLAKRGAGVVSGMAMGIDAAAHWGCLRSGGFPVAVLGTGVDVVYPASNRKLWEQVVQRGLVLSEFPMGTPPEPRNFPIRNRIISGLSKGVVVVEASRKSGSLITANFALDQGREVFAVPGSIDSFKSTGTHMLIKQGAKLVENADDVLEEFDGIYRSDPITGGTGAAPELPPDLDPTEKKIVEHIGEYPVHVDHIVRMADTSAGEVLATLMKLELRGIIRQLPGKMFVR
jgi:DNA processing protein